MTSLAKKVLVHSRAILFFSVVLIATSGVCQAWWPYTGSYSGWFPGFFPRSSDLERLPHYAIFPPVYYSHPVPRSYGGSPFASLPEVPVSESSPIQPLLVRNPYVASPAGTEVAEPSSTGGALIVRNPFVGQTAEAPHDVKRLAGD
jgi:hypothetical protein